MNYLIRTLPAIFFVLLAYYASAQPPDWADPAKRQMQFKHEEYILGYASEINKNNDNRNVVFERLIKNAKAVLIESVLVSVRSETSSFAEETDNAFYQKHFSNISVEAQMDIAGTNVERYHDIKSNKFYVLVYAKRDEVYSYYSNRINNLLHEVGDLIRSANQSYKADYLLDAIKTLNEADAKLIEARNKNFMLFVVKPSRLQTTNKWLSEISDLKDKVEKLLRQIYSRRDNTLSNAVYYLVSSLQGNASDNSVPLLLKSFTYENTGRTSSFSAWLNAELTSQLVRTGNYTIIKQKADSEDHYTVEGTYWDGSNEITIYLSFIGKNNRIKAGSRYFLSKKWLKENNVDYLPDFTKSKKPADNIIQSGRFSDARDGKTYRTVSIGRQTWMAENLAFKPINGNYWTYQNDESKVDEFGYLYDWQTANNACPRGWKLPSDADWNELINYAGNNPGKKLKATGTWRHGAGAGTDEFGFAALPGGYRNPNGSFDYILQNGYWWSATEKSTKNAFIRAIYYSYTHVNRSDFDKADGFSVRCIKIN